MCDHCGCESDGDVTATNLQTGEVVVIHQHDHGGEKKAQRPALVHAHEHHHHDHDDHEEAQQRLHVVELQARVVAKNDSFAAANRKWLSDRGILALNLMSAPGAGKTALLERLIGQLGKEGLIYVLEGDQATSYDGERVRAAGAAVIQVNTGTGCHLDAHMVAHTLAELRPRENSLLLIENVGNLVCPALFDLGEHRKVAILSVTEGDDKPLKYPHMFQAADLVLLNKIDLLPYVDFDMKRASSNVRKVSPGASIVAVSARTGEGMDVFYDWLRSVRADTRTSAAELGFN